MSLFEQDHSSHGLSPAWLRQVELKERSRDPEIRSSFFLGTDVKHGVPVYLPRRVLDAGHYVVRGTTGIGKTSATLLPIALQVLRGFNNADDSPAPPSPLIIIDLKGDDAFFHAVWEAALRARRKFRYFSVQKGNDYHFFDPFQIFQLGHMSPVQLATTFVRAFSLDYGLKYGGLYFTHQNLVVLYDAIQELQRRPPEQMTIAVLSDAVSRIARANRVADAHHIQSCLKLLAAYPQVHRAFNQPLPTARIDMRQVLENCEVVYFHLRLLDEAPSLRQVASFAMYSLIQAAQSQRQHGRPQRDSFVIVDEFYHIAGQSFGDLLSTVREWGLRFVLSHQTPKQLEHHDPALPDVIQGNTSVEQAYSVTPEDERYFREASGETRQMDQSVSYSSAHGISYSISPGRDYSLSDAEMKQTSDTPLRSLLLTKVADGRLRSDRVRMVQAVYPLDFDHYTQLRYRPLPVQLPVEPEIPTPEETTDHVPPQNPRRRPARPAENGDTSNRSPLHARMGRKWAELEGSEQC